MNNKYYKWSREQKFKNMAQNGGQFDPRPNGGISSLPKNLAQGTDGPIAKVRRIAEKNLSKGQNSLQSFFGTTQAQSGVKSNKAAFDHYITQTNAYSSQMLSNKAGPPAKKIPENPESTPKREVKGFLKGYQKEKKFQ